MGSVDVVQGDLLDQEVDVIVNPWNRNMIPWFLLLPHGVSGAIRKRAGTAPFRELGRRGFMRTGDARLTSAGRLRCKGIIHVAGLTAWWTTNLNIVRTCVRNACELAVERDFQSIGFPLIGAGVGGLKQDAVVETIREALTPYADRLDARIVVYGKAS